MGLSSKTTGQTLEVTRDGSPLTTYRYDAKHTKPYFWPVIGPFGAAVTRQFPHVPDSPDEPHDHPHHRGLHFTHGEVSFPNEPFVDFWSEDAKSQGRIVHVGFDVPPNVVRSDLTFTAHNQWRAPDDRVMLEEHTAWCVSDLGGGTTLFSARITLTPAKSTVIFRDTKEGSFSIRIPTCMDEQQDATGPRSKGPRGQITNSNGLSTEKQCWGQKADWVNYEGVVEGKRVALTMFDHPDNRPRAFWHVRGYGLFSANPFGQKAFSESNPIHELKLDPGQKLVLRYGLLVSNAENKDAIGRRYGEFVSRMR